MSAQGERGTLCWLGAVVTVEAREPQLLPPADSAPVWLRLLMLIAGRLPTAQVAEGFAPRGVVAAPTTRHLPLSLAASAVPPPSREWVSPIGPDVQVATVLSKQFQDVPVSQGSGTRLNLGGIQMDGASGVLPPAAVLPPDWDLERSPQPLPPFVADDLRSRFPPPKGERSLVGEWLYQQMCLEPVVILTQRPARLVEDALDLADQEDWWNWCQEIAVSNAGVGDWSWFRRPVVVMSPQMALSVPWASQVPARMVVVVGLAAWMSPARHLWSSVPQVLMLNQRSTDVSDFRQWFDNTSFGEVTIPGARNIKRGGLTLTVFGEPVATLAEGDEDEWDL